MKTATQERIEHSSEFERAPTYRIPKSIFDALLAWTGHEPSQSNLQREVDAWLKSQSEGRTWT